MYHHKWIYQKKKKKLMNAFFNSQFSYCRPLCGWVNRFHERCLRLIYNDKQLTFEEPLQKDGSISIHIRNLQALAIEMYKAINGSSPEIMKKVFRICEENGYNLKHQNTFKRPIVNSVYNDTETVSFLGPKIWDLFLQKLNKWSL